MTATTNQKKLTFGWGRPPKRFGRWYMPIATGIVGLSVFFGLVTYAITTGMTPITPTPRITNFLLITNLVLMLTLLGLILIQVLKIWRANKKGQPGARLNARLVALFSVVAVLPAIVVAVFATLTLSRGLDAWFASRVSTMVDNAVTVAQAYLEEHSRNINGDVIAMAQDINRWGKIYEQEPAAFTRYIKQQTLIRNLQFVYLIDKKSKVQIQIIPITQRQQQFVFEPVSPELIEQAEKGGVILLPPDNHNRVSALVKLTAFPDFYLYVFRFVDPNVVAHLKASREARTEYTTLAGQRYGVQVTFAVVYTMLALILLFAAIWFAIWIASGLARPIGRLVLAAESVSQGKLATRVPISKGHGDIVMLSKSFNHMTEQLENQHTELVSANQIMDQRRRFTEAVLAGVTAGVIGFDDQGRITLANRSACTFLQTGQEHLIGRKLVEVLPEMTELINEAIQNPQRMTGGEVVLSRDGQPSTLTVRIASETLEDISHGFVLTFDDITDLVAAQRNTAWSDIARRIAHEIKNPLTPIQLSTERLQRRYRDQISNDDRQVFDQCTETIIRQVSHIGRMVDEFSSFARMPSAKMEKEDPYAILKEVVSMQKVTFPELSFELDLPEQQFWIEGDRQLISQSFINLIKNAAEAIAARKADQPSLNGKIWVRGRVTNTTIHVELIDNGCGLPKTERHRLIEPYMTTNKKGTGLGLAIVKKIVEDHNARLSLQDSPWFETEGGAMVSLEFPLLAQDAAVAKSSHDKGDKGDSDRQTRVLN